MAIHKPVLLNEVIKYLSPQPNENFIDATIGGGGHALAILQETQPNGKLLGIDWNREAIENLKLKIRNSRPFGARLARLDSPSSARLAQQSWAANLKSRVILVNNNFVNLSQIVKKYNFQPVSGIIIDLGLSSDLLEKSGKGFSFQKDEFLDMRFGEEGKTAYEIINKSSLEKLNKIFREYGEEKFSDLIALNIIKIRQEKKIRTTEDLVDVIIDVIKDKVPERFYVKIFARIFQALRIIVNNELENLKKVLYQSAEILITGGRIGIISFHSLEDRIVKNFFREKKKEGIFKIINKKPIIPTTEEIKNNPCARSAKFRVAQKI